MHRLIGISTHAVGQGDVRDALELIAPLKLPVVEVSALRIFDPEQVLRTVDALTLSGYTYVSFHTPHTFARYTEADVSALLAALAPHQWSVVVHPDSLLQAPSLGTLGKRLCIENMDKRKADGRTLSELERIFARHPEASLCFDIGHVRQVDPTMSEAALILRRFQSRLKQVHLSEVNSRSGHESITHAAIAAFRKVAHLIPTQVPIILETPCEAYQVETQLRLAKLALTAVDQDTPLAYSLNGSERGALPPLPSDSFKL